MFDSLFQRMVLVFTLGMLVNASPVYAATTSTVTPGNISLWQTIRLLKTFKPNLADANGWASDLLSNLKAQNLPQSKENVCAVIAVIAQESNFVANPAVPNLGKIAEQAIVKKVNQIPMIGGQAESFLYRFPTPQNSFMNRIRKAKTERDLDLAYRDLVRELTKQFDLNFVLNNDYGQNLIESSNEINTIGAMQVGVGFVVDYEAEKRGSPLSLEEIYQLRDALYTRQGGLHYGILQLLGYETGYNKKLYRFADFNAGHYASRNAAFQHIINGLSGKDLDEDGDLLMYDKQGNVNDSVSQTEQAIRYLNYQLNLNLADAQIRRDLILEKTLAFNKTTTYKTLTAAYKRFKKAEPAYAIVPTIYLSSQKTSRLLTTAKYANTVNGRYQRCIAVP